MTGAGLWPWSGPGPGPRPSPGSGSDRVFDGQVVAPGGSVLVTVTGYQTTDLGRPPDLAHAARLARCLDRSLFGRPAAGR